MNIAENSIEQTWNNVELLTNPAFWIVTVILLLVIVAVLWGVSKKKNSSELL